MTFREWLLFRLMTIGGLALLAGFPAFAGNIKAQVTEIVDTHLITSVAVKEVCSCMFNTAHATPGFTRDECTRRLDLPGLIAAFPDLKIQEQNSIVTVSAVSVGVPVLHQTAPDYSLTGRAINEASYLVC